MLDAFVPGAPFFNLFNLLPYLQRLVHLVAALEKQLVLLDLFLHIAYLLVVGDASLGVFLDRIEYLLATMAGVSLDYFLALFIKRIQHVFLRGQVHSLGAGPHLLRPEPLVQLTHQQHLLATALEVVVLHQVGGLCLHLLLPLICHVPRMEVLHV